MRVLCLAALVSCTRGPVAEDDLDAWETDEAVPADSDAVAGGVDSDRPLPEACPSDVGVIRRCHLALPIRRNLPPNIEGYLAHTHRWPTYGTDGEVDGATIELDGDSLPDLLLAPFTGQPSFFHNDGGMNFTEVAPTTFPGIGMTLGVVTGDVDADGRDDIVLLGAVASDAVVDEMMEALDPDPADTDAPGVAFEAPPFTWFARAQQADGSFADVTTSWQLDRAVIGVGEGTPTGLELLDVDGDADNDLLVPTELDGRPGHVLVFTWDQAEARFLPCDACLPPDVHGKDQVILADVTGDYRRDVVALGHGLDENGQPGGNVWEATSCTTGSPLYRSDRAPRLHAPSLSRRGSTA